MKNAPVFPIASDQQVTASDLVRHFGIWQERAGRGPVYILHRGRPRLVMTSVDVMDALCSTHSGQPVEGGQLGALLDALGDMIVVLGAEQTIIAASRGARAYFGDAADVGAPVSGLASPGDEALAATVTRVAVSGLSETTECRSPRFPDRLLAYAVDCVPAGCIVQISDATAAEERQHWRDRHDSAFSALEAAGAACAIINLRGRIEQASPALAKLTGASVEALSLARIVSLVTVGDRSTVGEAFEAAIDERTPQSVTASLLVGGAELRPVRVGLAPLASSGRVVGVTVVVTPTTS
ncbi:PAS domain-containing protein [uncultured Sphingomonas sp.]|uniref:PAS domain-containing protein n=1 Tax=unclassified Sphingomonas TaxID=196159 RepID=UPI0025CDA73F|nr:PAS domain-containing protein [uncultured Sphingomonas sp.]